MRISLLLLPLLFLFQGGICQPWKVPSENGMPRDFFTQQKKFNEYWQDKKPSKGSGWKQFRRWEYFMEPRVDSTGFLPDQAIIWKEYKKIKNSERSQSGNWSPILPTGNPAYGGGGRINCIRFNPLNSNIIWAGSPGGGLWKSINGGATWSTNTDLLPNLGVSDIAISNSNPDTMYIATGDADGSDTYSFGVLRSVNGGISWDSTGLFYNISSTQKLITRLVINPSDSKILLASTETGLFKSINAGVTWQKKSSLVTFRDIEFKPGSSSIVYACTPTAVYKSTDAGETWINSSTGLNTSGSGRMQIAVTPANPDYLYVLMCDNQDYAFKALYRSTDGGASYIQMSTSPNILGSSTDGTSTGGQGFYDLALAVSPTNTQVVYVGGVNIFKSSNGGTSWSAVSDWTGWGNSLVHADIHALEFLPGSGSTLFAGSDGAVFKTTNSGSSWTEINNGMNIFQAYKISVAQTESGMYLEGCQDNGSNLYRSSSWREATGGDGMECIISFDNANVMYTTLYYGELRKSSDGGNNFGWDVRPPNQEGGWITPYVMAPGNSTILYAGFQDIWKTTNGASTWTKISTNLTNGNNIEVIALSASDPLTLYTSYKTKLYKTEDGGSSWSNLTGMGISYSISALVVNPTNPKELYVSIGGYSATKKIIKTTDGGLTWKNITLTGLPNLPVNCIVYRENSPEELYVGTDLGVYFKDSTMTEWRSFNNGLPNVIVNELEIQKKDKALIAGTYGRGLWKSDLFDGNPQNVKLIDPEKVKSPLMINPNPFKNELKFKYNSENKDPIIISVMNIEGKEVMRLTRDIRENGDIVIPFEKESNGIYLITIEQGDRKFTEKVVKE